MRMEKYLVKEQYCLFSNVLLTNLYNAMIYLAITQCLYFLARQKERELPEDWDHFHVLLEQLLHRVPSLGNSVLDRLCNGPEAFSPDCKWIAGEAPEVMMRTTSQSISCNKLFLDKELPNSCRNEDSRHFSGRRRWQSYCRTDCKWRV